MMMMMMMMMYGYQPERLGPCEHPLTAQRNRPIMLSNHNKHRTGRRDAEFAEGGGRGAIRRRYPVPSRQGDLVEHRIF